MRLLPSVVSILLSETSHRISLSVNGAVVSIAMLDAVLLDAVVLEVVVDCVVVVGGAEDVVAGEE